MSEYLSFHVESTTVPIFLEGHLNFSLATAVRCTSIMSFYSDVWVYFFYFFLVSGYFCGYPFFLIFCHGSTCSSYLSDHLHGTGVSYAKRTVFYLF